MNAKYGTTIIYTSHYMEEIQKLCKSLIILDNGKEVIRGTKEEVLQAVIGESVLYIELMERKPDILIKLRNTKGVVEVDYEESLKIVVKSGDYRLEDVLGVIRQCGGQILNMNINQNQILNPHLSLEGYK